uniref:Uncharacterized protein n=1 Tax=Pararge aegeria TaxID=116150 RepID=S4P7K6_9NEOP
MRRTNHNACLYARCCDWLSQDAILNANCRDGSAFTDRTILLGQVKVCSRCMYKTLYYAHCKMLPVILNNDFCTLDSLHHVNVTVYRDRLQKT